MRTVVGALLACFVLSLSLGAATGTIMPSPFQTELDANGNPIVNGKICTYTAGTSTPATTYTDVGLMAANTNPIRTDTSGRFVAFLPLGASFKFVYQDSTGTAGTCDGAILKTVDNISAVPGTSAGIDVIGTAGEALTAGQAVYLSAGDGSKTAGLWYKADSAATYSSTLNIVGMVPASISSAASGSVRLSGSVTGLSALTTGGKYYVGTAGAITSTAPANARLLGQADTTTTLALTADPPPPVTSQSFLSTLACGRLTLTTAVPVTTADVTGATTLYYTPVGGCNQVALWNGSAIIVDTLVETSIVVPSTTSQMYDVFAYDNAGAVNIEALAWTNDTTRATAISLQNGFYAKAATPARRYVGSFRTTTVSGQTEDSGTKRYVWNYYHRVRRFLVRGEATASWTYTTATWRQANAAAANQVEVVVGVAETLLDLTVMATNQSATSVTTNIAVGEDSTTAPTGAFLGGAARNGDDSQPLVQTLTGHLTKYPPIGRHYYAWLEASTALGTTTWYGTPSATGGMAGVANGLVGWCEG